MPGNWDQSAFDAALARYIERNRSRTLPQILDTKGYYIARAATRYTAKADRTRIQTSLGQVITVQGTTRNKKTGITKMVKRRKLVLARNNSRSGSAPLAALILQHRRTAGGHHSLFYGKKRAAGIAAMNQAIKKMIGSRMRSVTFLKSGWLTAIKKLAATAVRSGAPAMDVSARQVGKAKGDAKPAQKGFVIQTQIINLAFGNKTTARARQRALTIATRGLQQAFDSETRSMNDYMDKAMKADADKFNQEQR